MYIDALIDRDKDIIHVVERVNGKRVFREYPHVICFITKIHVASLKVYLATNLNVLLQQVANNLKKNVNCIAVKDYLKVMLIRV